MASEIQAVAYINLINLITNKGIAKAKIHIHTLWSLPEYILSIILLVFLRPICHLIVVK